MATGRLQFFYHSKKSKLPVRDVTNSQRKGHKTEPHLEIGAENYIYSCVQPQIRAFCQSSDEYLFLFTTCKDIESLKYNRRVVVGYLKKDRPPENRDGFYVALGTSYIVPFEYSVDLELDLNQSHTVRLKCFTMEDTERILKKLHQGPNILDDIIREIIRLDPSNHTCLIGQGKSCIHQMDDCRRWKILRKDELRLF